MRKPIKILLAVDHSEYSSVAVRAVAARPWPLGTQVRVFSVVEPIPPPAAELWYDLRGDLEQARLVLIKRAKDLTERNAELLKNSGLFVETAVREGDPRLMIVKEAKDWMADLIVVGSHGYTGIKKLLLGSISQYVVSHAPCSVEVVRQKLAEKT